MEDLLSYRLSDLLLFSESTFYRQFERFNQWLHPFQYFAYIYGLLWLPTWRGGRHSLVRILAAITACLWLVCLYAFMYRLYAQVNWMLPYLMVPLGLQPLLLIAAALRAPSPGNPGYLPLLIWISTLLMPAAELASGRPVAALSAYALTPDSLALCSVVLVLVLQRSLVYSLPALVWLLYSVLTYIAMENPMAWYLAALLLLTVIAALPLRPGAGGRRQGA